MEKRYFILALFAALSLFTCHAQKHQHGKASYYSKRATGSRSASGQKIHHDSLTCAHKFYPFGSHLKVTNLSNGKSVIVKVIDRGPFGKGRIIDLSWAAAKEIGMIAQGVATVKVELQGTQVPFLPEDDKLPKIDFEMAESDYKDFPKWKNEHKNENKDTHHNKPAKTSEQKSKIIENNAKQNEQNIKKNEHNSKQNEQSIKLKTNSGKQRNTQK